MKRLSRDVSRCFGKGGERLPCPEREQCARYVTIQLDLEAGPFAGHPKSYVANLRGLDGVCRHRIEVEA